MTNRIINGDCTEVLQDIPSNSVDFTPTDPPYCVQKPDTLWVSFYGWQAIDAFMAAWKAAGFAPVGHIHLR